MPRYLSTSPFETVVLGLSVGDGATVHPADGNPTPVPGSTVVLNHGDELDTTEPTHFPGCFDIDAPTPTPTTGATPTEEPTP